MPVIHVHDIDDPRLEDYRDIRERQLQGPGGLPGLFVGETRLIVECMLRRPGLTKSVLLSPKWVDRVAPLASEDVPVYVAGLDVIEQVAGFNIHRGMLAMGRRAVIERPALDPPLLAGEAVTLLLCEDISNIDNMGLLFRNAAAFGVDAVLLSPRCHDPLYRKSLRVSIAHVLDIPFVRCRDWAGELRRLKQEAGITLIAAATGAGSVEIDTVPRPKRVGLVVGQEYDGVSSATLALCDRVVRIPMAAGVDSLNVAVAAAVCLHRFSTGRRR